jgi:hypothetical protein
MATTILPSKVLDNALPDLNEHASTLHALGLRLGATDPDGSRSALAIAQELWEVRKSLGDGRHEGKTS